MNLPTHRPSTAWRLPLWAGALSLWLLPWAAMQFTREVQWEGGDFLVFGVMLLAACGAFEGVARITDRQRVRWAAGMVIALIFGLTWAELAVGLL